MKDIVAAAASLFSHKGFQGTSTQELADATGLVKATLYYHIGSKEELLFRVALEVTEERIRRWRAALDAGGATAAERLERLVEAHCDMLPEYRDWFIVVSDELKHLPALRLERVLSRRAVAESLLTDLIQQGHDSAEFHVPDARAASMVVIAMLNSMTRWYRPRGRLKREQIVKQVSSLVLHGVAGE